MAWFARAVIRMRWQIINFKEKVKKKLIDKKLDEDRIK